MKYYDLTTIEKDYVSRLTEDEKTIYLASTRQLNAIDTWDEYVVRKFSQISRVNNELNRIHERYNEVFDALYDNTANGEQRVPTNLIEQINGELLVGTIAIGSASVIIDLVTMDDCDAMYEMLAKLKMNSFDRLCDDFDIPILIETLVSHELY